MVIILTITYLTIRIFSLITYHHPSINQLIAIFFIGAYGYLCTRKPNLGWLILVGELFLGGAGHFFEFNGLLLRTWLLLIFVTTWLWGVCKTRQITLPNRSLFVSISGFGLLTILASLNGWYHHHELRVIIQDAITFGFIGLLLPSLAYWRETIPQIINLAKAWLVGSALFSLATLAFYSSGFGYLPDTYYHWFRNNAAGKITDLGNHFFRIVLPEHIIIIPIILLITAWLIREPDNKKLWFYQSCALLVLALNFSRMYFFGLIFGLIILAYQQNKYTLGRVATISLAILFLLFISVHTLSSRGQASGLALLGVRLGSNSTPTTDTSGAIRLAILPNALEQIKAKPIWGSGLGATVTYLDPATQKTITRTQFDWGYLELIAEFGVFGLLFFIFLGIKIIIQINSSLTFHNKKSPLPIGLLAGTASLMVINVTTPALFHGFGILYLVVIMLITDHASAKLPDALIHTA